MIVTNGENNKEILEYGHHHTGNKRKKRIAMLAYAFYESDNRVRRYAESLSARGDIVEVLSLRRKGQKIINELNNVKIYRIQERERNEKGKFGYLFRVIRFFFHSLYTITIMHLKNPYDLIHVHSVPDFEVFAAIIPKLTGTKVILDIHDIVPEFYAAKFNVSINSLIYRTLLLVEKISIAFSNHVIISNSIWEKKLCSRSVRSDKCTAIINYPDPTIFKGERKRNNDSFIFLYPGTLNHHQGLDIAILAFEKVHKKIPRSELHIIGDGPAKEQLKKLVIDKGLERRVKISEPVPLEKIAHFMANADIGIIPKRNDKFGGEAFSTKTLEFMLSGVPIIVSRTKIDNYYFNDSIVKFFEPENIDDLASAMLEMANDPLLRNDLRLKASEFVNSNNWHKKAHIYLDLFHGLICHDLR